ncbi:acyltransferase [Variovorax sp. Sphag1AA]|uniref:acyltransferase family protein n=1 Tax=Variovorax sp. Sphag1AA TaxID=2587027 RepID=UPI00160BC0B5|nr:acyltransferase [Variovorax sp. Sphag1AA]MBB3175905.1 peptidoglycan/LPS O-acetylase OafA/YrhL [Variovorax sp. Sphag1AA]
MKGHIPALTGLRCVAVMMVVFGHASTTVEGGFTGWLYPLRFLSDAGLGVQIFFVLSGFLITNILHSEWEATGRIDLLQFYIRRTLRIWPAFYAFIIVLGLLSHWQLIDIAWQQFTFAALHMWNYSEALGLGPVSAQHLDGAWYLGHFWSLSLEEQFYWFWPPLLIFLLHRRSTKLLAGLILFVPIVRVASYYLAPNLRGQLGMMLHTGVDSILVGCYVSLNKSRIKAFLESSRYSAAMLTAGCLLVVFVTPVLAGLLRGYWSTYGTTLTAAIVGLIIMGIASMEQFWLTRLLKLRPFVFIGTISYSLYLWQQLFLSEHSPVTLGFPLNILQAIVAATLSYWLIETPFLKLKDARKRTPGLVAPVQMRSDVSTRK